MLDTFITSRLQGRRVLIVEDDRFLAQELADLVEGHGAKPLGPVATLEEGLQVLLWHKLPDLAVLDVRVSGERTFDLADTLTTLGVPFLFASAHPSWSLPESYETVPHCEKPIQNRELLLKLAKMSRAA